MVSLIARSSHCSFGVCSVYGRLAGKSKSGSGRTRQSAPGCVRLRRVVTVAVTVRLPTGSPCQFVVLWSRVSFPRFCQVSAATLATSSIGACGPRRSRAPAIVLLGVDLYCGHAHTVLQYSSASFSVLFRISAILLRCSLVAISLRLAYFPAGPFPG
jgi:hypothetical protein